MNNNNIINTETGEWGLSEAHVKSWAIEQELTVLWSNPFFPIAPFEFYAETEPPEHNADTHKSVEVEPERYFDIETQSYWQRLEQAWKIVPLNADELAQREAERLAAEQAARDAARVTVTKRQALLALFDLRGIKDSDIEARIDSIPDETQRYRAKVDWQGSAAIESDSPTVLMLASALSLSDTDLRGLFDYAQSM